MTYHRGVSTLRRMSRCWSNWGESQWAVWKAKGERYDPESDYCCFSPLTAAAYPLRPLQGLLELIVSKGGVLSPLIAVSWTVSSSGLGNDAELNLLGSDSRSGSRSGSDIHSQPLDKFNENPTVAAALTVLALDTAASQLKCKYLAYLGQVPSIVEDDSVNNSDKLGQLLLTLAEGMPDEHCFAIFTLLLPRLPVHSNLPVMDE